ncbi:NUDIX domain-containing protein [Bacillus gobiensis]|uniref:NUDIX domain-containing protein n=1 Tax=Bacillus gobiensis TaxID=1441095 RepID=UPI003D213CA1
MESEILKIFDDQRNEKGTATREEVHKKGFWHETFHCWFVSREDGVEYLYFQLRSETKKDYPNLFDITAAGHLLADETVRDGIREVKEEIGIDLSYHDLVPLGVVKYSLQKEGFLDNEMANVFMYENSIDMHEFELQKEEVSGIVKVEFTQFYKLCTGEADEIRVQGFQMNRDGKQLTLTQFVGKDKFVPHDRIYYEKVLSLIKENR